MVATFGVCLQVIASAICHDDDVRAHFAQIAFVAVGQPENGGANLRDLQSSLHLQLTGKALESTINDEHALLQLCEAAVAKDALLIIDDPWDIAQVKALACLDTAARSAMVVTTRLQGLLPAGCLSFPIGVLPPETAVALLLEVSNTPKTRRPPPSISTDPMLFQAVEACGHLPLAVAVAGSMLEQLGGVVDDNFLRLLTEDRGEAIREGEFGDEHVALEDRIITSSLASYAGAERESVVKLFHMFALFPEDVPVPAPLFDRFASSFFGGSGKRPQLQVPPHSSSTTRNK